MSDAVRLSGSRELHGMRVAELGTTINAIEAAAQIGEVNNGSP
ncbi:hypothetical protein [Rhizobium miluonense]|jgi:hypothetical protein|uniref:Uncharacterized protein n=1 Tax=Rhizobium miluonense TaxID=411945 RepID=A0ABU1SR69_9HYPH|nr:hypothetical protein [Rhizobium miluonense]MDR6901409.1 hypothetical protein [Rhizobium miluonense]